MALERLRGSHSEALPAVSLYRDDIEHVIEIMSRAGGTPKLSDDELSYESIDELITHRGRQPSTLKIDSGGDVSLNVHVRRFHLAGVMVMSWTARDDVDRAYMELRDLLKKRRRFSSRFLSPHTWWSICGALMILLAVQSAMKRLLIAPDVGVIALFGTAALGGVGAMLLHGFGSTINLARRHEASSFMARNGEKLLVGAIGAIIGAFGKALVDWLRELAR